MHSWRSYTCPTQYMDTKDRAVRTSSSALRIHAGKLLVMTISLTSSPVADRCTTAHGMAPPSANSTLLSLRHVCTSICTRRLSSSVSASEPPARRWSGALDVDSLIGIESSCSGNESSSRSGSRAKISSQPLCAHEEPLAASRDAEARPTYQTTGCESSKTKPPELRCRREQPPDVGHANAKRHRCIELPKSRLRS